MFQSHRIETQIPISAADILVLKNAIYNHQINDTIINKKYPVLV
jgi:hypothetical protein